MNETIMDALVEVVERKRQDPKFKARVRQIIEDRELRERIDRCAVAHLAAMPR